MQLPLSGAFTKREENPFISVMFRSSARLYQLGFHCADFHEN
jgi:hypothetical protein